ncbi:hypothetical protein BH23PSE1_BH23PSE1_09830 [soil metagenome]
MTVRKQSVSFSGPAFAFAQALVEAGEYSNVSAAVSGELVRAKARRDQDAALLAAEVERRRRLPDAAWIAHDDAADLMAPHRQRLARLRDGEPAGS